jgi:hypothetical protein
MLSSYLILANRTTDQEGTLPAADEAVRRKRLPRLLTMSISRVSRTRHVSLGAFCSPCL